MWPSPVRGWSAPLMTDLGVEMANILNIRTFGSLESVKVTNTRERSCPQKKRFHYLPWNTAAGIIYCHCEISQEGFDPPVFLENAVPCVSSTFPLISSPKLTFQDGIQLGPKNHHFKSLKIWTLLNITMPFLKPSSYGKHQFQGSFENQKDLIVLQI